MPARIAGSPGSGITFALLRAAVRVVCLSTGVSLSLGPGLGGGGLTAQLPPPEQRVERGSQYRDADEVRDAARAAQSLFERRRTPLLPIAWSSTPGPCDEHVGRFCTWYSEGEWHPVPEDERIVEMRRELIEDLDALQTFAPDDEWILGQRVWYRSEGGDWAAALSVARACGRVDRWWCAALEGFSLHGAGDAPAAERAFDRAFAEMPEEAAREWRLPGWAVESGVRDLIDDVADDPTAEAMLLERMWQLADPLYLAPGNDRRTSHYSRWVVSELRDRARNPFRIGWSEDLTQLTVRHGWEMGWERTPSRIITEPDNVTGHKHPEGRDFMPSRKVLESPLAAEAADFRADLRRPRSLYAPAYAPVLLPMSSQIAVFPRGETMVIVASHVLPEDTTFHAEHDHPRPWMEGGAGVDQIGLFALSLANGAVSAPVGVVERGRHGGALRLEVPAGDYVVSAESWSPEQRRAGRRRVPAARRPAPEDIATLSDILLLAPGDDDPPLLEAAMDRILPEVVLAPGQPFAIGWEVVGLGFREEMLDFELSVERQDRGFFGKVGGFLGLSDRPRPLSLSWEEAGPREPGHRFHYLDLDVSLMEEGRYRLTLVLATEGRSDATSVLDFEVRAAR